MGAYPCKPEVTLAVVDAGAEHLYKYNGLYKMNVTQSGVGWPYKIGDVPVETLQSPPWAPVMPTPAWWESEEGNAIWMADDLKWRVGALADKGTDLGDIMEMSDITDTGTTCPHEYVAEGYVYPCEFVWGMDEMDCDGETYGPSEWQYKKNEEWVESGAIFTKPSEKN